MDETLSLHEKSYQAQDFPRHIMRPAVEEPYNKALETNIKEHGLKFPLIALPNTYDNWKEATLDLSAKVYYDPQYHLLIVYGNQRLRIIDKLEVKTPIPVFLADSHVNAILIHAALKDNHDEFILPRR
jgi:hypothetical protein